MKKLLSFVLVALFAFTASAQVTWNAKAGFGVSSCISSDGAEGVKAHFVGKIGVGMEYPISSNFSLMPSAEFALKGASFIDEEQYSSYGESFTTKYRDNVNLLYFQIPVLGAYRFNLNNHLNLVLKAGPYFAFGFYGNVKSEIEFNYDGNNEKIPEHSFDAFSDLGAKRFELGLDFGVDFELKRFVVGAEYEIGLTPIIGEDDFSLRNSAFYVTVGYKF